jgi:hypothetical protein
LVERALVELQVLSSIFPKDEAVHSAVLVAEKAVQKASTRAKRMVRSLARDTGGGAKPADTKNDHTFEDDNDSRPQGQQLTQVKKVLARMKVMLSLEERMRKGAEAMLADHRSLTRSAARAIGK